jgi:UDP-glucose 4-epimerase
LPRTHAPSEAPLPRTTCITGIAGNLGQQLARLLHTRTRLVGVDRRPFPAAPPDVVHCQTDIRKRKVEELFRQERPDAVLHMGIAHDPRMVRSEAHDFNVLGTHHLFDLCLRQKVKKLVVLSSANVYGPRPENSNFLTEETPLLSSGRFTDTADLVEIDIAAQSFLWRHPELETVILRPVHIVGPTVQNAPSNYLRLERPVTVMGFDPIVQLIHEEDACRALALALRPGVRGVYNIVGPGELYLSNILRELGRSPVPVPSFLLRPLLRRAYEAHLVGFPPEELDYIQYLCAVDGSRAVRELGWSPSFSLRSTIRSILSPA